MRPGKEGIIMAAEIRVENFTSLAKLYDHPALKQNWSLVFNLPVWLQAWWEAFGAEYELCLYSVWQNGALIGIAPLMRRGEEACLLGSPDVCDYLDFVAVAGKESDLLKALIPELQKQKISRFILNAQRPDSVFFKGNLPAAGAEVVEKLYSWHIRQDDHSYELLLASSWEDYLAGLNKKQRHEVRRKLRRLEDGAKGYRYRVISDREEIESFIPCFFDLFQQNPEKAEFFTEEMESYFRLLITAMAEASLARFGLLEIDNITAAAVFYFDYRKRIYLYNSGYRSDYSDLSVGLLSKILCIRDNIDKGRAVFDFLKGEEIYKSRLGGTAIPIHTATLSITQH
jgi:CelD/BcsL family acetyltransferase involved in cellulose biosynthesis